MLRNPRASGFTIVELLIVIVVIGILAALVLNTFAGAQKKARDAKRQTDIASIVKGLEVHYLETGAYPQGGTSTVGGLTSWSTTGDPASWQSLATKLQPYMGELPSDPTSTLAGNVLSGGASGTSYNYAYFSNQAGVYCGSGVNQMFLLAYRLEASAQTNTLKGACTGTVVGPYAGVSNYRKTHN